MIKANVTDTAELSAGNERIVARLAAVTAALAKIQEGRATAEAAAANAASASTIPPPLPIVDPPAPIASPDLPPDGDEVMGTEMPTPASSATATFESEAMPTGTSTPMPRQGALAEAAELFESYMD